MNFIKKLDLQPEETTSVSENKLPSQKDDDNFDLKEQINESELDNFWSEVEKDIQNDPEWFNFSE